MVIFAFSLAIIAVWKLKKKNLYKRIESVLAGYIRSFSLYFASLLLLAKICIEIDKIVFNSNDIGATNR